MKKKLCVAMLCQTYFYIKFYFTIENYFLANNNIDKTKIYQ